MFFFLFEESSVFKRGSVCELIQNDPRRATRPDLYPDRMGKRVIVSEVFEEDGLVWAYEARPARYRINQRGKRVCEYDPRCVTSLYWMDHLQVLDPETAELTHKLIFMEEW